MCQNCGFRALCPHVRARIELEAARAPHEAVRDRLLGYAVRVQGYAVQAGVIGGDLAVYYCRICSERVAEAHEEADPAEVLGRFGELDSGLRTKVWVIAITAARQVRFPVPTDERVFATGVASVVFPLLLAAEGAAGRKRRPPPPGPDDPLDDDPEIDPLIHVDALLYVHAYILELIRSTQAGGAATQVGYAGVKPGAQIRVYGDAVLRHVAEAYRNVILRAEEVTPDYMRARLKEAFQRIQAEGGLDRATERPEIELAVQTTTMDPVYRYAAAVARVAGDLPCARPADPAAAKREFETILGNSLPGIIRTARESAKDPALAALYLRRTGLEVPPGGTLNQLLKDPRVNLHATLYGPGKDSLREAWVSAFRALARGGRPQGPRPRAGRGILEFAVPAGGPGRAGEAGGRRRGHEAPAIWTGRVADPPGADAERGGYFEAYRLFAWYTRGIKPEDRPLWDSEMEAYRECSSRRRRALAAEALQTYYASPATGSQQYRPPERPVTLARLYDENGLRHDWARGVTYYYSRPPGVAGPPVEIRGGPEAVKKAQDSGQLKPGMALLDLACSVCGVRASALETLDLAKVDAAVRRAAEIDALFIFYEARCPMGDTHDMAPGPNGSECQKCGLEAAALKAVAGGKATTNLQTRAYYDRFARQFAEARQTARALPPTEPAGPLSPEPRERPPGPAGPWHPDYSLVVQAAELAETTAAAIEAIGSTEGREYADVLEGRGLPEPPADHGDPRLYGADAEVRLFLSDYARLRYFTRFAKAPPAAAALVAAVGVPAHELAALADDLPDVGAGYSLRRAEASQMAPPDTLAWTVQTLCRFVTEVASISAPPERDWVPRLGLSFAKQELQLILRNQRLLAKPGAFNWTIFIEDDEGPDQDQVGDVGEDVLADILGADAEEAPDDPFSGEHIDYDTSENEPNNEPA